MGLFLIDNQQFSNLFLRAHFAFILPKFDWNSVTVTEKHMQRLAPKVMVAIEMGSLTPRRHHPAAHFACLNFVGAIHCHSRNLAVFLGLLAQLFVFISIDFQHLNVFFDAVFVLDFIGSFIEHILILG